MAVEITWGGVIVGALSAIGGAYLARRGQNLADRHDVTRLTQIAEDIRSAVRVSEDHTRSLLAKDASTHVKRFEVELPIYQDLWNKVVDLDDALDHVRVAGAVGITSDGRTPNQAYAVFRERLVVLQNTVKRLEPFFAPEVSEAVRCATLPLRRIAAQSSTPGQAPSRAEQEAKLEADTKEVVGALHGLREAIRTRLLADAIAVSSIPPRRPAPDIEIVVRNE
jgi:hypothetical protein